MNFVLYVFVGAIIQISEIHGIEVATVLPQHVSKLINETRRILEGVEVSENRPYMVYLKIPQTSPKMQSYRKWLCGGVIIHEEYILTSAACIEDVDHFYVVSGTYKYSDQDDRFSNFCIKNGSKKAVWKCVPKNYIFDGHENDNIRWMNNDIAVVKIEDGFDFTRRVRGCQFIPKPICYNNQSQTLENPGTVASIAGWGTTAKYNDWASRRQSQTDNQQNLLEATVEIIPKKRCKRRWGSRYHNIIDNYMICSNDIGASMSEICNEKYVDCQDINYSDEDEGRRTLQKIDRVPMNMMMHSALHKEIWVNGTRRLDKSHDGGFCENDHGGPLVVGRGVTSIVIGIISACLVKERTNKCYGPFLYTSVYKNRQFISCAIYKDVEPHCRRQFRSGVTHEETIFSWKDHPDGPAKNEKVSSNKNVDTNPAPAGPSLQPPIPLGIPPPIVAAMAAQAVAAQAMAAQAMAAQAMAAQGVSSQGVASQAMAAQAMAAQAMAAQGLPAPVVAVQGMPPQAVAMQGLPPQGVPPQGVPPQGVPPQGVPLHGVPVQGMPAQGMPPPGVLAQMMVGPARMTDNIHHRAREKLFASSGFILKGVNGTKLAAVLNAPQLAGMNTS